MPVDDGSSSIRRRVLAGIFIAAVAGIFVLTWQLPRLFAHKPPGPALLGWALAMFSLALTIGGIFVWFVADRFKRTTSEFRRVQGIVQSATGAETRPLVSFSPGEGWRLLGILLALPVVGLLIHFLTRRLFPSAPSWTPFAAIWVVGFVLLVVVYLTRSRSAPSGLRRGSRLRLLVNLAVWFALVFLLMRFDPRWLSPYIGPKGFLIAVTLLCLSLPFFVWVFGFLPLWWIGRALARADYAAALRRADLVLRVRPHDAGSLFFRGTVLLLAGRYPEAERALRESVEAGDVSATYSQSVTLANLGDALVLQGRYEEALRDYDAAAKIHAGWGRAYSGMAEVHLWRDIEPERALALVDRALERKLRSWFSRRLDRDVLAQMYADRAWALALLGRTGEFRADLEKAFHAAGRKFRPGLASVHYRAGRAFLALHDGRQAGEHFRRAEELDPGSSGIEAARMLRRAT